MLLHQLHQNLETDHSIETRDISFLAVVQSNVLAMTCSVRVVERATLLESD
jgi:hypothetical protein